MTQEQEKFLNELKDSGVTNMFGAGPYLEKEFNLNKDNARNILIEWITKFN